MEKEKKEKQSKKVTIKSVLKYSTIVGISAAFGYMIAKPEIAKKAVKTIREKFNGGDEFIRHNLSNKLHK